MGLFNATPQERAAKAARKAADANRRQEAIFAGTPAGKARAAKSAGMKIFQIDVPLSKTKGTAGVMLATAHSSEIQNYASVIQSIEDEGWRLEHAGYVYRVTRNESRDKILESGQQETVTGEIVAIYIFRAT